MCETRRHEKKVIDQGKSNAAEKGFKAIRREKKRKSKKKKRAIVAVK